MHVDEQWMLSRLTYVMCRLLDRALFQLSLAMSRTGDVADQRKDHSLILVEKPHVCPKKLGGI